jgi:hypothetical protein
VYITIVWDVNHQTDACTDTLSGRCTKYTNEIFFGSEFAYNVLGIGLGHGLAGSTEPLTSWNF